MTPVTLTFRPNNKIPCGQDRSFFCGVPAGIAFQASRPHDGDFIRLVAPGYGLLRGGGENYGSGAIYACGRWVRRRFESAQKRSQP